MNEPTNLEIKAQLDRIERMLRNQAKEASKKTWLKAGRIMELTGWTKERLRQMRDHGVINWKNDNGFFYELESVPEVFIKKATA
jgi:hypothetical protein